MDQRADAIGVDYDLDEDGSGAVDYDGLLLSKEIEDRRFVYVPHTEYLQNCLVPGYFACVIFTTGWERSRVQFSKRIFTKQRCKAKKMECPFLGR